MIVTSFSSLSDSNAEEIYHDGIEILTGTTDAVATESPRFPSVDSVICDIEERWDTSALVA